MDSTLPALEDCAMAAGPSDDFHVRRMLVAEAGWMIQLAADEGWNPGVDDADLFFGTDPAGFLVGELGGRPVGCLAAVAYGDSFGFIGLYIVVPEHRGRGYGWALWEAGMARLGGRNIGLDGVVAQQDNYRRSGFRLAYRQIRHVVTGEDYPRRGAVDLSAVPFERIEQYDRLHFAAPRTAFLRRWLGQPSAHGFAAFGEDGSLLGYGVTRRCREGHKIGPLFAGSPAIAEQVLGALLSLHQGEPVYLDTPEANRDALRLARAFGMTPVFETARMYTHGDPGFAVGDVYGVTTFELG